MIASNIPIGQVMTTPVIAVHPDTIMSEVQDIFESQSLHHLPVVKENKVVGIISKTDYYRLQHNFTFFKRKDTLEHNKALMRSLLVSEVMIKQVATVHPEMPISVAVGIFKENLFHALPVVDDEYRLVGILTTYDLLNYAFSEDVLLA